MPLHRLSQPWTRKSLHQTSDPATLPSLSPFDPLVLPNFKGTSIPTMMPSMPPAQVPLLPIFATSIGSAAAVIRTTGLSVRSFRSQQSRYNLVHLLSAVSLTNIPTLVEAIFDRLSSIARLRAAKHANLEALLLPDRSAPSPDNIKYLIFFTFLWGNLILP